MNREFFEINLMNMIDLSANEMKIDPGQGKNSALERLDSVRSNTNQSSSLIGQDMAAAVTKPESRLDILKKTRARKGTISNA